MLWFLAWQVKETSEERETYLWKTVRLFINDAGKKTNYMLLEQKS